MLRSATAVGGSAVQLVPEPVVISVRCTRPLPIHLIHLSGILSQWITLLTTRIPVSGCLIVSVICIRRVAGLSFLLCLLPTWCLRQRAAKFQHSHKDIVLLFLETAPALLLTSPQQVSQPAKFGPR